MLKTPDHDPLLPSTPVDDETEALMKLVGELWMLTPLPSELEPDSVEEASEEGTLLFSTRGHTYLGVTNPHRTDFKEWGVEFV